MVFQFKMRIMEISFEIEWEKIYRVGIFPKLIHRTTHIKHSNITKEKFAIKILLGTNSECTRNFSHGIIPIFYWIFS
jgi:hypothetical protein